MTGDEMAAALAEPFEQGEVKVKPQSVTKDQKRAMCVHYIDARLVMQRLDDVVGPANWKDDYDVLPGGEVLCRLSVRLGGEWVTKCDIGGQSEQPDEGDKAKAAVSDALKRAAVKWGIGRYLYRLPRQWCDYDAQRRQITNPPRLPDWALPKRKAQPQRVEAAAGPSKPSQGHGEYGTAPPKAGPAKGPPVGKAQPQRTPPGSGRELRERLEAFDAKLARQGLCGAGELLAHVEESVDGADCSMEQWTPQLIAAAVESAVEFERQCRERTVNDAQAGAIKDGISRGRLNAADFNAAFGIADLAELPRVKYDSALKWLAERTKMEQDARAAAAAN